MGTSQVSLTLKLTTSYPRLRSANSAKNPLGVFQTPILLRKTVVLAAYSHPPPKFRNALCGGIFLSCAVTRRLPPKKNRAILEKAKPLVGWEE